MLASPPGQNALLSGDVGTLIRLVREALDWRQTDLGHQAGFSQPTISRLENGRGRISDLSVLARLADVLGIPRSALGLAEPNAWVTGRTDPRSLDDVKRSEFLRSVVGAAAALALPSAVLDQTQTRLSMTTVTDCRKALDRLYGLDDQLGGSSVFILTTQMVEQLRSRLTQTTHSLKVGTALREITASTAEHAGWLAFDAGQTKQARHWWLEALHLADLAEAPALKTTALVSMALQASTTPKPTDGHEAINLVDFALRTAGPTASPRLVSLLHARQALGYAKAGERQSAHKALLKAEHHLDQAPTSPEDEPAWLHFWGHADLACHQARTALYLTNLHEAERAARAALEYNDANLYPRNNTIYSALLGNALVRSGRLEEALSVTRPVVTRATNIGSHRIRAEVHHTIQLLSQHQDYKPVRPFISWTRRVLAP